MISKNYPPSESEQRTQNADVSTQDAYKEKVQPTPRTDALEADLIKVGIPRDAATQMMNLARQLERELAEARSVANIETMQAAYWKDKAAAVAIERNDLQAAQSASAEIEKWKQWAEYAKAEYRKATGRDLPQDQAA